MPAFLKKKKHSHLSLRVKCIIILCNYLTMEFHKKLMKMISWFDLMFKIEKQHRRWLIINFIFFSVIHTIILKQLMKYYSNMLKNKIKKTHDKLK